MEKGTHPLQQAKQGLLDEEFVVQRRIFWAMLKSGYQLHSIYADRICICHKKAHGAELQKLMRRQEAISFRTIQMDTLLDFEWQRIQDGLRKLEAAGALDAWSALQEVYDRAEMAQGLWGDE
jgi:hypothetical protein